MSPLFFVINILQISVAIDIIISLMATADTDNHNFYQFITCDSLISYPDPE